MFVYTYLSNKNTTSEAANLIRKDLEAAYGGEWELIGNTGGNDRWLIVGVSRVAPLSEGYFASVVHIPTAFTSVGTI